MCSIKQNSKENNKCLEYIQVHKLQLSNRNSITQSHYPGLQSKSSFLLLKSKDSFTKTRCLIGQVAGSETVGR